MISGVRNALLNPSCMRSTTSRGMPAGPISAYQPLDSNPGIVSATVATFGSAVARLAPHTPIARNRPDWMNGSAASSVLTWNCTWPATVSFNACPAPLYGILSTSIFAVDFSISTAR